MDEWMKCYGDGGGYICLKYKGYRQWGIRS